MTGFQPLVVGEKRAETAGAVTLTLVVPVELRERFRFRPGQYLTLRGEVGSEMLARSYSISSTPSEDGLSLTVKRLPEGRFSTWLVERVEPGMAIEVLPPLGCFTPVPAAGARTLVGIAAGSGITPLISITRSTLEAEPESRVVLLYGNRERETILFRRLIQDLKDRFLDRLSVHHVLSREPQELALCNGRIDAAKIAQLCTKVCPPALVDGYFLCGPATMIEVARAELLRHGVAEARIHTEHFAPDGIKTVSRETTPATVSRRSPAVCEVTVLRDGAARRLAVRRGQTGVLEAARATGIDLPQSCIRGVCGTCRAKLVAGRGEMAINHALPAEEVAKGFVLSCQLRPLTPTLTLDFDRAWDRS